MRLTIEKPKLARALAHMASVVERRNTIPILSNVLLTAGDNALKLTATDLDMEVVETVDCTIAADGAVTVPAHMFNDIVRKLPDGDIAIDRDAEQERLTITSGPAQFSLQTLPAEGDQRVDPFANISFTFSQVRENGLDAVALRTS